MPLYDKRNARPDAEALVRRRIDASRLRYRKADFGLAETDRLADHFALVVLERDVTRLHGSGCYQLREWGVTVNGSPAGYISGNFTNTRHKFLAYGFGGGARIVPEDQVPEPGRDTREAAAARLAAAGQDAGALLDQAAAHPRLTVHSPDGQAAVTFTPPGEWLTDVSGYPAFTYRQDGDRAWEIRVQETPGAATLGIGEVARSGSLPSMQRFNGRGRWPGAAWTRSRPTRQHAARDVWREHQQRAGQAVAP